MRIGICAACFPKINALFFQPFVRETEVAHGPDRDMIKTEVVLPVIEVPTTEPLKQMIGSGMIAGNVEGVPVQNGLTTLNQVAFFSMIPVAIFLSVDLEGICHLIASDRLLLCVVY